MKKRTLLTANKAGLIVCVALLASLTGCMTEGSNQRGTYRTRSAVNVRATVVLGNDYDYFPGYEIYYNRNRHEYVYRDGRAWVRRREPRGVSVSVLFASPSVRLDFHDSPARHHGSVVQRYPRNWAPPAERRDDRDDRREDGRNDSTDNRRD